jgi:cytokinin dehydrogenase
VSRRPRAVLRPGTVEDVVRIVRYANARGLPIAMRGRGYSRYGLALVDNGIAIEQPNTKQGQWRQRRHD